MCSLGNVALWQRCNPLGHQSMSQEFPNPLCSWNINQSSRWRTFPEQTRNNGFHNAQPVPCSSIWETGHLRMWSGGWPRRQTKALFSRALKFFVQLSLCYFLHSFTIRVGSVLFRFSINSLSALVMCDHTQRCLTIYIYSWLRFLCPTFTNTDIYHTAEKKHGHRFNMNIRLQWNRNLFWHKLFLVDYGTAIGD